MEQKLLEQTAPGESPLVKVFKMLETRLGDGIQMAMAGGSVRKAMMWEPIGQSDIDIFFMSKDDLRQVATSFEAMGMVVKKYENCYGVNLILGRNDIIDTILHTLGVTTLHIQMIFKAFYTSIESLLTNFDFTVCQFAYQDGKFFYTPEAVEHDAEKILVPASPIVKRPANRLYKYISAGYTPNADIFFKFFLEGRTSYGRFEFDLHESDDLYGF